VRRGVTRRVKGAQFSEPRINPRAPKSP